MHEPLIPHRIVVALIAVTLLLPITICVVFGVSALLDEMGDTAGGAVLHRIALGCGILWGVDLISLVIVLAVGTLRGPDKPQ